MSALHLIKITFVNGVGRSGAVAFVMAAAYLYGANDRTDALFWATSLVFWMGGSLSMAIELQTVPHIIASTSWPEEPISERIARLSLLALMSTAPILLPFGIVMWLSITLMPMLKTSVMQLSVVYVIEMVPFLVLLLLSSVWTGFLATRSDFTASGWGLFVRWAIVIMGLPFLESPTVGPLWGLIFVLGEIARMAVLCVWSKTTNIWKLIKSSVSNTGNGLPSGFSLVSIIVTVLLLNATPLVNKAMGSFLGSGRISLFEYAWTVYVIPMGLISCGVLTVAFTRWARVSVEEGSMAFATMVAEDMKRSIKYMTFSALVIFLAAGAFTYRPVAIGELSIKDSVDLVKVMAALSLGLPATVAGLILLRALVITQSYAQLVAFACGKLLLITTLNWVLITPLGLVGIGLSTAMTETTLAVLLYTVFLCRVQRLEEGCVST